MTEIMLKHAPLDWPRKRLGQLFRERREKVSDKDFLPLSVTKQGILPQLDTAAKTDDGDNRKGVRAGDFVINSRSDRKGSGGLSDRDGSVSLINIVLEPRSVEPRFAHHLLRSPAFQEEFYRWGHGIVADLWTTRYSEMKNILLAIPDLETQKAIADFLDRETARIDQLIEKKQRLVELLEQKRSAEIESWVLGERANEARTTTASPFIPVLPRSWSVERVRFAVTKIEQGWSPQAEERQVDGNEWGVLKVGCVNGGTFRITEHKALPPELPPRPELEVRPGDLLMSRGNSLDLVGSAAIATTACRRLMLSDLLYRLTAKQSVVLAEYLALCLNSRAMRRQIELVASGSSDTMPKISQVKIRQLVWPRAPLTYQRKALVELERARQRINALVENVEASIARLREFRAALITAAVTGQVDVTTWGKQGQTDRRLDRIEEAMRA